MEKKYIITKENAREIRIILKEYEKTSAFRKLQAVMLIGEGKNVKMVSEITLYHSTYIYELIKQFCTLSFSDFIKDNRGGANHRNLTDEQETQIINKFEEKAINGQVVSLANIKKEYEEIRGEKTSNSTFYSFLKRKGWRRVMPRGQHPKKASDEDIESSKKLTFK